MANERFFNIDPHKDNPSAQDGCYILNKYGINEVERFAFFSKAVYALIKAICVGEIKDIAKPNVLIANDWHSGALSGLLKYFTVAQVERQTMLKSIIESKDTKKAILRIILYLAFAILVILNAITMKADIAILLVSILLSIMAMYCVIVNIIACIKMK